MSKDERSNFELWNIGGFDGSPENAVFRHQTEHPLVLLREVGHRRQPGFETLRCFARLFRSQRLRRLRLINSPLVVVGAPRIVPIVKGNICMYRIFGFVSALLLLGATIVPAGDRLAVFEFFGRPGCGNCEAASGTVTELQHELEGRAVLLTYHYDFFGRDAEGRIKRFWVSEPGAEYLPLAMIGSGYRTSSGVVDFDSEYRGMIDDEVARPPRAAVSAYWRRVGASMRVYLEIENSGEEYLEVDLDAAAWVIAYMSPPPEGVGLTDTWVQAAGEWQLPYDLGPGETVTGEAETPALEDVQWNRMHALVLVEDRPGGGEVYDMAQATRARPAGLTASPEVIVTGRAAPSAELVLEGPHVLSWTASSDVSWIEVTPDGGNVPATVTVTVLEDVRPPLETEGQVTFSATGDGMSFETVVDVAVGARFRKAGRRMSPVGTKETSRAQPRR